MMSRHRLIVDTDAKNEADDQYAIVHALLTPTFEIHGLVAAHFGDRRSRTSMQDSRAEIDLLLRMLGMTGTVRVGDGAAHALPDERTPVDSPGARLIIEEAMRDDPRPLHVAFLGPLTDMASALLLAPHIADRDVRVIWIGGGAYPSGGREFNLSNDIAAARVVFESRVEVWQIPQPVYQLMAVSYAELDKKVAPLGELGDYLVRQLKQWNATYVDQPIEHRSLGDSPAVGVVMYPNCGRWQLRRAPRIADDMSYAYSESAREIRVYDSVDARFVLEDMFAKLERFAAER